MNFLEAMNECKKVSDLILETSSEFMNNINKMFSLAHEEIASCIKQIADYRGVSEDNIESPSEELKSILKELKFTREQLENAEKLRGYLHPITHAYCPDFEPEGYAEYLKNHYIQIGKQLALKESSHDIRIAGHQGKSNGSPRNPDPEPAPVPRKK